MSELITTGPDAGQAEPEQRVRSLGGDAWQDLRRKPVFWLSVLIVVVFVVMAIVPRLFTAASPVDCDLSRSLRQPGGDAWFGYDFQGCDVYARAVYGAQASIEVGVLSTLLTGVLAFAVGMLAGYFGGWVDAVLSRVTDIVLAKLAKRGISVIPDIMANAGGVTVSYYEWLQNKRMEHWTEAEVNRRLEYAMKSNYRLIQDIANDTPRRTDLHDSRRYVLGKQCSTRAAAMVLALKRIEAHYLLEGFSQ